MTKRILNFSVVFIIAFISICFFTYIQDKDTFVFSSSGLLIATFFSCLSALSLSYANFKPDATIPVPEDIRFTIEEITDIARMVNRERKETSTNSKRFKYLNKLHRKVVQKLKEIDFELHN